jgi:hypothetical protein
MKNKIESKKHKDEIKNYIIDSNCSWKDFCIWCKDKYDINKNYATDLWMECWKDIETQIQKNDLIKAQTLINRLEDIFEETMDDRIKLQVIEQLRKIGGIDASDKLDVNVQGDIKLSWGDELDEH